MSVLKDIAETKQATLGTYLLFVSASICPGILMLYMHKPDLFINLNFILLLLLAAALTNPVLLINIVCMSMLLKGDEPFHFELSIMMSCLVTYFIYGLVLLVDYLVGFSFQLSIILIVLLEILFVAIVVFGKEKMQINVAQQTRNKDIDKN